jgi:hypothetical protein
VWLQCGLPRASASVRPAASPGLRSPTAAACLPTCTQSKTGNFDPNDYWGGVFDPAHRDTFYSYASNPTRVLCDLPMQQATEAGAAQVPATYDTPTKQGGPEVLGQPAALPPVAAAILRAPAPGPAFTPAGNPATAGSLPGVNTTGTIRVAAPPGPVTLPKQSTPAGPANMTLAKPPLPDLAAISSSNSSSSSSSSSSGTETGAAGGSLAGNVSANSSTTKSGASLVADSAAISRAGPEVNITSINTTRNSARAGASLTAAWVLVAVLLVAVLP